MLGVLLAAGLASYPLLDAGRLAPLIALLGGLGTLLALLAAVLRGRLLGAALFALGAEFVTAEATGHIPAVSVVAYAAGLIVLSELVLRSAELPLRGEVDAALAAEGLLLLAGLALAAALLALLALAAGGATVPGGAEAALIGCSAAIALLALPRLLARRSQ
ncbi:MAG: hypothetical protein ACXVZO_05685 [Gaiellaceae bacterium]